MKENPNFDFYTFNLPTQEQKEQQAPLDTQSRETFAPQPTPTAAFVPPSRPAPDHLRRARRTYSRCGWALTVMLIVWYAAATILQVLGTTLVPVLLGITVEELLADPIFSVLTGTLPLYVFGVPALALVLLGLPCERPQRQRFGAGQFTVAFFIAIALAIIGNMIGSTLMNVIGSFSGFEFSNMLEQALDMPLWMNVLCMVILAPVFEELIFRKLLMDHLLPYGELGAIVMTSLLFGAIHGNFYQFFYAALLGALLGYVYLRSGKVWLPMLMHALFNLFGGVLPNLLMQGFDVDALLSAVDEAQMLTAIFEDFNGFMLFGLYYMLYYSMAAAGVILLLVFRKRLFLAPTRDELPRQWRAGVMFGNAGMIVALVFCAGLFLLNMIATAQPLM